MSGLRDLQRLVQEEWRERGPLVDAHVGDLAWWSREPERRFRAWHEGGRVVGWGWLTPPADLDLLVARGRNDLTAEILDWFESEAAGASFTVSCLEADDARAGELERRGYRLDEGPFFVQLCRALDALPEPAPPPGYVLRPLGGAADVRPRVEVQRAAFISTMTEAKYERLRRTWPYRPELDLLAEADDGSFAAFCTSWLDDENGAGELEPVGTRPDHQGRGLAKAGCLAALHALRRAGATLAVVYARGDAAYPAPLRLYRSLGFEPLGRKLRYVR